MSDEPVIHEISEAALPDFLRRIAVLSGKSMKLLGKPITPVFHGDVMRKITVNGKKFDADGAPYVAMFHRVSVTGETPKIHGWIFCGTIDHRTAGNILRSVPGAGELPIKFRTVDAICEHCGVARRRNDTFILRCEATGEYKQIGRQCCRDFIGFDVTVFTETAKWLSGMEPSDSDGEGGYGGHGGTSRDIMLTKYLAHVHACIRKWGWVSAKEADIRQTERTSSAAIANMFPLPKYRHLALPLTDRDYQIAEQAVEWVRALQPRGDYEYNLTVVAAGDFITFRDIGLAASMISGLYRHQEQTIKRAERLVSLKNSQHIGASGAFVRLIMPPPLPLSSAILLWNGRSVECHLYRYERHHRSRLAHTSF